MRVKNCIATLALASQVHVGERHCWTTAKPFSTKEMLCSSRVDRSQALGMEMQELGRPAMIDELSERYLPEQCIILARWYLLKGECLMRQSLSDEEKGSRAPEDVAACLIFGIITENLRKSHVDKAMFETGPVPGLWQMISETKLGIFPEK